MLLANCFGRHLAFQTNSTNGAIPQMDFTWTENFQMDIIYSRVCRASLEWTLVGLPCQTFGRYFPVWCLNYNSHVWCLQIPATFDIWQIFAMFNVWHLTCLMGWDVCLLSQEPSGSVAGGGWSNLDKVLLCQTIVVMTDYGGLFLLNQAALTATY